MKTRTMMLAAVLVALCAHAAAAQVKSPSELLGMKIGEDRVLADYRQISTYFRALDAASDRVQVVSLGKTTLGEDMLMAVVSSERNLKDLERIKGIAKRLADPRGLSDAEADALVREGRAVVLVTCNIHSNEIAASQMAMEWAHALATAQDPETKRRLDEVVLLLVPSLNPDGQTMETEWYRKQLGTPYEGSDMPWLYHPYVGHDNNRDWFMLTQKETRAMNRAMYHEWFPQVVVDEHQMGSLGPRMFIPPFADPLNAEVHPLIWREINLIGSNMAFRLEQAGKTGLIYGYSFDAYWVGGVRNTPWWKNVTGLLLETASARRATPMEVDPTELRGGGKGLVEYGGQINHPNPWRGGTWRMRDIMDYERIASDALLEIVAERREDFLRNMLTRSRAAIAAGEGQAYRIPDDQRDPASARRLALLMLEHGVEVLVARNGDYWIPLGQPYGPFVRELFEPRRYPEIKPVAGTQILRPYDVTAWALPMMMGVQVEATTLPGAGLGPFPTVSLSPSHGRGKVLAIAPGGPEAARVINAALRSGGGVSLSFPSEWHRVMSGSPSLETPYQQLMDGATIFEGPASDAALEASRGAWVLTVPVSAAPAAKVPLRVPRVAIYKPWTSNMDEGWTRWVLEQYGFEPKSLTNDDIKAGKLAERFDAIVLPDMDKNVIATGRPKVADGQMRYFPEPPEPYRGGLGPQGATALEEFVSAGGTLIALSSSSEYVIDEFAPPVRNALATPGDFSAPGSLMRVDVTPAHPVTYGLPREAAIFVDAPIAFETIPPAPGTERWVLATYPEDDKDILLSGWASGLERLERRAAAVAVTHGKGRLVLFGFRPQFRAQTTGTFPFLFNALYWSTDGR